MLTFLLLINIINPDQAQCMAEAIYFEARGEPNAGQVAVGNVIMNRVRSSSFPNNICEVVHQGTGQVYQCHFSYYCDSISEEIKDAAAFTVASYIAISVMLGKATILYDATHYHADTVSPYWAKDYKIVRKIGKHIFYR